MEEAGRGQGDNFPSSVVVCLKQQLLSCAMANFVEHGCETMKASANLHSQAQPLCDGFCCGSIEKLGQT